MVQLIEFHKVGSDDNPTYRFAGRRAWFKDFGEWYGRSVATVGISNDSQIVVIGWEDGYITGAQPWDEQEVWDHIHKITGYKD